MASPIIFIVMISTLIFATILQPVFSQDTIISTEPSDQSVEQFIPVVMRCSVNNLNFAEQFVSWLIDDTQISSDAMVDADATEDLFGPGHNSSRYEILLGVILPTISVDLSILSAQGVDNGRQFKCVVCTRNSDVKCNGRFQLESRPATLEVNYRPDINTYPICNSTLPNNDDIPRISDTYTIVVLGQPVILNCTSETAKPSVELSWHKTQNGPEIDGTLVESNGFSLLEHQFTADLSDNGTQFVCQLRSEYFNLDQTCILPKIKVVSPPTVIVESPGAVPAGRSHEFVCKASTNTSIPHSYTYKWDWDPTFSKPAVNTTKYGSVLSTNALNDDDGDEVRCTVTDSDGLVSSASSKIVIEGGLSIGIIIGIVVACVCFICLIGLLIFLVVRKKNKSKSKKKKDEAPQPSAVPMLPSSLKPTNAVIDV